MPVLTYVQAKALILSRLRSDMATMPASERGKPRYIIDMKAMSVLDLIANVERDSVIGKSYVYSEAKNLGYAVA